MNDDFKMRICGSEPESIVDGPGFRYVLFVQGCPHRCPGCHNPQSHDFDGGTAMTIGEIWADICIGIDHLAGVTFSGGEPFCQVDGVLEIAKRAKERGLSLMSYTGYTYEQLVAREDEATDELLGLLDMLVDGRFEEAQKDLTLLYRGSENQRVIDVPKTRAAGEVVIWKSPFDLDF